MQVTCSHQHSLDLLVQLSVGHQASGSSLLPGESEAQQSSRAEGMRVIRGWPGRQLYKVIGGPAMSINTQPSGLLEDMHACACVFVFGRGKKEGWETEAESNLRRRALREGAVAGLVRGWVGLGG